MSPVTSRVTPHTLLMPMSPSFRRRRSTPRASPRILLAAGALFIAAALPAQGDSVGLPGTLAPARSAISLPTNAVGPFSALSRSALALGDSIVVLAREQIGKRYVHGGQSPRRGFDCSGLVRYIADALHITVPRTARQQARVGEPVPADTALLLPGDILTFGRGSRASHVGIYVGNGRFIHASTKAGHVIETSLMRGPAPGIKPWLGARRLVGDDSASMNQ